MSIIVLLIALVIVAWLLKNVWLAFVVVVAFVMGTYMQYTKPKTFEWVIGIRKSVQEQQYEKALQTVRREAQNRGLSLPYGL